VSSIKAFYPGAIIYVADDSRKPAVKINGVDKIFRMQYDMGLSAGRNELVRNVQTKYLAILDDDFVFDEATDVRSMAKFLDHNDEFGLVGGWLRFSTGGEQHYEGWPRIHKKTIYFEMDEEDTKLCPHSGLNYKHVGIVLNFFVARTEMFKNILWDLDLKLAEHTDFFLRLGFV